MSAASASFSRSPYREAVSPEPGADEQAELRGFSRRVRTGRLPWWCYLVIHSLIVCGLPSLVVPVRRRGAGRQEPACGKA
jgi:hypothetical protein